MKLEILKSDEGVEIHLIKDDGSKTVWLCEDEQAAFYKLSSLVFSTAEDPKQAKRSILVGDFQDETAERKASLKDRAERVKERLGKTLPVEEPKKDDSAVKMEELIELLKKGVSPLEKYGPLQPAYIPPPFYQPTIPSYPYAVPTTPPNMPYVGDPLPSELPEIWVSNDGSGFKTGCFGMIGTHMSEKLTSHMANDQMFYGAGGIAVCETPMGTSMDSTGTVVTTFKLKTNYGKAG